MLLGATLPQNSPRKLLEEEQDGGNLSTVSDSGGVVRIWPVMWRNGGGWVELDGGMLQTCRKQINSGNGCGMKRWGHNTLLEGRGRKGEDRRETVKWRSASV
jgi:hypothetical protein